jgi:hypothetical protein
MARRKLFVDTKILPSDVFTYHDNDFYSLINQLAGPDETALLKIQGIRTINAFLRTANIFDILNIDSEEIKTIKEQTCFILKNDDYIVKPGIKSSIEYLHDLFSLKQAEIIKNTNGKRWSISNISSTIITTPGSSVQAISSTDTIIQQSTTMTTTTTIDEGDHRSYIIKSMNEWCLKHADEMGISDLKLIEGTDYLLTVSASNDSAHIRCGCRASARLPKQGKNFQLSNYYRHLKSKTCAMLKAKQQEKNSNVNTSSNITIQEEASLQQQVTTVDTAILSSDPITSTRSKRPLVYSDNNQSKNKRRKK